MPVRCTLQNGKWVVTDKSGKTHGKHDSEGSCKKQAAAINANMEFAAQLKPDDFITEPIPDLALHATSNPLVFEKQVIYEGQHRKGDQEFEVDVALIDHWVDTSKEFEELGIAIPSPIEHTTNPEARRATVKGFSRKQDSQGRESLYATLEFRDEEAAKLAKTTDVSLYSPAKWEAGGKDWKRPIVHVALTDYPVIHGLDEFIPNIVASLITKGDSTVDPIQELLGDLNLSLTDGEDGKTFLLSKIKEWQEGAARVSDLETKVKTLEGDLKLAKANQAQDPSPVPSAMIKLQKENRELKLSQLVEDSKISPHVAKGLSEVFCNDADLKLSLGLDRDDNFDALVALLRQNEVVPLSSQTPVQGALTLSKDEISDPNHNPLLANAEKRRKAAGMSN